MGNCNIKDTQTEVPTSLSIANFHFHYCIGKGGFGKVWKVEYKKTKQAYALKEMSKSKIISKRSVSSVINERQLLSQLRHDFLINMVFAFQDRENLYLVMDLLSGGDLRYHISKKRKFPEKQVCNKIYLKKQEFFSACIIMGLEYLHQQGILHRDIKPENLVFDKKGYLRITDLGIARIWKPDNSQDTSGTPGYMAPEVMCRQNHGVAVDYYAMGIIIYECMMGKRPYLGKSRQEIRDQILAKQIQIKKQDIPEGWSLEAADFTNRLIQRKSTNRLGLNGPEEVKSHPWFRSYDWQKLASKEIIPEFIPNDSDDNFHVDSNKKDSQADQAQENAILLRRNSIQGLFEGYNNEPPDQMMNYYNSKENISTRLHSGHNRSVSNPIILNNQ